MESLSYLRYFRQASANLIAILAPLTPRRCHWRSPIALAFKT
jgi:hypothetical protein